MKRKIITLVFTMAMMAMFSTSVMAADEVISGFYDIGTAQSVTITPYVGTTQATVSDKDINNDTVAEKVYVDSDRIEVTYGAAAADNHYGVILVEGSGLPTKDTAIYYINQETAASSSVNFNVYPKIPEETTDMTLYISSSVENSQLVSVPMNYAVNATVAAPAPSYIPGNANNDAEVDVKDVIAIRQHLAGGYGITINEEAANVNKDADLDVKDVIMLRQYLAGGYGIEL